MTQVQREAMRSHAIKLEAKGAISATAIKDAADFVQQTRANMQLRADS